MTPRDDTTPPTNKPPTAAPPAARPQKRQERRGTAVLPPAQQIRVPADFVAKLKRFQNLLNRIDGVLDALLCTLRGPVVRPPGKVDMNDNPTKARPIPPLEWIEQLEASVRADGTVDVVIDDRHFDLQPHLGALFLALAEDTGSSVDEGVGFKSMEDLRLRIGKRIGGHPPSRDTLNKYIHKLRRVMAERAGLTDEIIQTNRRLGRRLAVKRSGVTIW